MLGDKMLEYEVRAKNRIWWMKERTKEAVHDFFVTEDGDTNFISIVIVLVIVIALAALFRKQIAEIVNAMWNSIFADAGQAITGQGQENRVAPQNQGANWK